MTSLWKLPCGARIDVPLRRYAGDFQTLVGELRQWEKLDTPRDYVLHVHVRPYGDFKVWAERQEPDWDRYGWDAANFLYEEGLLSSYALANYDTSRVHGEIAEGARKIGYADPWKLGFDVFMDAMAASIRSGKDLPPLVAVKGRPKDGRHRTLAALRLGLRCAPVVEIAPERLATKRSRRTTTTAGGGATTRRRVPRGAR